jgi:hypothetical protein
MSFTKVINGDTAIKGSLAVKKDTCIHGDLEVKGIIHKCPTELPCLVDGAYTFLEGVKGEIATFSLVPTNFDQEFNLILTPCFIRANIGKVLFFTVGRVDDANFFGARLNLTSPYLLTSPQGSVNRTVSVFSPTPYVTKIIINPGPFVVLAGVEPVASVNPL